MASDNWYDHIRASGRTYLSSGPEAHGKAKGKTRKEKYVWKRRNYDGIQV